MATRFALIFWVNKILGATVSVDGNGLEEVCNKIKEQIKTAFPHMQPDSNASLHNKKTDETHLYEVIINIPHEEQRDYSIIEVELKEIPLETPINSATSCAIAVTRIYHKSENEWEGCIHFE